MEEDLDFFFFTEINYTWQFKKSLKKFGSCAICWKTYELNPQAGFAWMDVDLSLKKCSNDLRCKYIYEM